MPEPVLPHDLVTAIGRVAVNGTRLESDICVTLWSILGHSATINFSRVGKFAAPPSDFARAVEALREAFRQALSGALLQDTLVYLANAKRLQGQRHDVVHSLWHTPPNERGMFSVRNLRKPDREMLMTVADVDALATAIHRLRGTLIPLLPGITAAIPSSTQAITVGPPPAGPRSATAGEQPFAAAKTESGA